MKRTVLPTNNEPNAKRRLHTIPTSGLKRKGSPLMPSAKFQKVRQHFSIKPGTSRVGEKVLSNLLVSTYKIGQIKFYKLLFTSENFTNTNDNYSKHNFYNMNNKVYVQATTNRPNLIFYHIFITPYDNFK